ncbi:MAG: hypothetical protein Q4G08_02675 [Capnocytophaga sp.]|nr:hypothetical protein [Capnocytophaga sp.]
MKQLFLITAILLLTIINMNAQHIPEKEAKPYTEAFEKKIGIPVPYQFVWAKRVTADDKKAVLVRYQKDGKEALKGEHFSFVITENNFKILGFTHMDRKYAATQLLSKTETERIAKDFLKKTDASLADKLENQWIERHDEEITVGGKKMVLAGMKYKCYDAAADDYAWVIIGADGSVVTFERDIKWNNAAQKRITEKWLHDQWLDDNKL